MGLFFSFFRRSTPRNQTSYQNNQTSQAPQADKNRLINIINEETLNPVAAVVESVETLANPYCEKSTTYSSPTKSTGKITLEGGPILLYIKSTNNEAPTELSCNIRHREGNNSPDYKFEYYTNQTNDENDEKNDLYSKISAEFMKSKKSNSCIIDFGNIPGFSREVYNKENIKITLKDKDKYSTNIKINKSYNLFDKFKPKINLILSDGTIFDLTDPRDVANLFNNVGIVSDETINVDTKCLNSNMAASLLLYFIYRGEVTTQNIINCLSTLKYDVGNFYLFDEVCSPDTSDNSESYTIDETYHPVQVKPSYEIFPPVNIPNETGNMSLGPVLLYIRSSSIENINTDSNIKTNLIIYQRETNEHLNNAANIVSNYFINNIASNMKNESYTPLNFKKIDVKDPFVFKTSYENGSSTDKERCFHPINTHIELTIGNGVRFILTKQNGWEELCNYFNTPLQKIAMDNFCLINIINTISSILKNICVLFYLEENCLQCPEDEIKPALLYISSPSIEDTPDSINQDDILSEYYINNKISSVCDKLMEKSIQEYFKTTQGFEFSRMANFGEYFEKTSQNKKINLLLSSNSIINFIVDDTEYNLKNPYILQLMFEQIKNKELYTSENLKDLLTSIYFGEVTTEQILKLLKNWIDMGKLYVIYEICGYGPDHVYNREIIQPQPKNENCPPSYQSYEVSEINNVPVLLYIRSSNELSNFQNDTNYNIILLTNKIKTNSDQSSEIINYFIDSSVSNKNNIINGLKPTPYTSLFDLNTIETFSKRLKLVNGDVVSLIPIKADETEEPDELDEPNEKSDEPDEEVIELAELKSKLASELARKEEVADEIASELASEEEISNEVKEISPINPTPVIDTTTTQTNSNNSPNTQSRDPFGRAFTKGISRITKPVTDLKHFIKDTSDVVNTNARETASKTRTAFGSATDYIMNAAQHGITHQPSMFVPNFKGGEGGDDYLKSLLDTNNYVDVFALTCVNGIRKYQKGTIRCIPEYYLEDIQNPQNWTFKEREYLDINEVNKDACVAKKGDEIVYKVRFSTDYDVEKAIPIPESILNHPYYRLRDNDLFKRIKHDGPDGKKTNEYLEQEKKKFNKLREEAMEQYSHVYVWIPEKFIYAKDSRGYNLLESYTLKEKYGNTELDNYSLKDQNSNTHLNELEIPNNYKINLTNKPIKVNDKVELVFGNSAQFDLTKSKEIMKLINCIKGNKEKLCAIEDDINCDFSFLFEILNKLNSISVLFLLFEHCTKPKIKRGGQTRKRNRKNTHKRVNKNTRKRINHKNKHSRKHKKYTKNTKYKHKSYKRKFSKM